MTGREFEIVKCIASDNGWDFKQLDEYCMRIFDGNKFLYDVWTATKKGRFVGFTVRNWDTKKVDKRITDIENFLEYYKEENVKLRGKRRI